jgi:hypothetical protein
VIAPVVGPAYTATAGAVNGVLTPVFSTPATVAGAYAATAGAIDAAFVTAGTYTVVQPRLVGAVAGMTLGLVGGLYVFSEPEVEEEVSESVQTTNSVVQLIQ